MTLKQACEYLQPIADAAAIKNYGHALNAVINAAKKQIQRPPVETENERKRCPNCGEFLDYAVRPRYCKDCGQKIFYSKAKLFKELLTFNQEGQE